MAASLSTGPFVQTTFLGASICGFDASIGWNEQQGSLGVRLAVDPTHGDNFDPPLPGSPVYFSFMDFQYGGILQNWEQDNSVEGNPTYNVQVIDPREILDGTQLILDGYNGGTLSTPNLLNPYGFLENTFGFGSAEVNEGGMPWYKVLSALETMISAPGGGSIYGMPLSLMGNTFYVDLSNLPVMPVYYRIGGGNISLLEAITQVCQDAGCDFFVRLVFDSSSNTNVIEVRTVSRFFQPQLGQIQQFVQNTAGVKAKTFGEELRNEVTTAFVVGGQMCTMYEVEGSGYGQGNEEFNTIWPYWGLDQNGNAIIGVGDFNSLTPNTHQFSIDLRQADIPAIGQTYIADVCEVRAAMGGEESWESYIYANKPQVAKSMGVVGAFGIGVDALTRLLNGMPVKEADFVGQGKDRVVGVGEQNSLAEIITTEQRKRTLFEAVAAVGRDYYGRKFMVRIPFASIAVDQETFQVRLSQEPTDGGWASETDPPLGLPAAWQNMFTMEDNRYVGFVRIDAPVASGLDVSQLSPEDAVMDGNSLFVKVEVDPHPVYTDWTLLESPRAVITMPGMVVQSGSVHSKPWFDALPYIVGGAAVKEGMLAQADLLPDSAKDIIANAVNPAVYGPMSQRAFLPTFAAIPLRSNVMTYGPWYNIGPPGKVHFERDETLVPWNYGGYDVMNAAGAAKVAEAVTYMQVGEMGRIDVPGAPTVQLGDVLIAGGPNVTQIQTTVGREGVVTSYHMRTYTPRPFGLARANANRLIRLGRSAQQARRGIRKLLTESLSMPERFLGHARNPRISFPTTTSSLDRTKTGGSPHDILVGNVIATSGDYKEVTVTDATFVQGLIGINAQDNERYTNSALMSMDGLFTPYSSDQFYSETTEALNGTPGILPQFEVPSGNGFPTVNDLNPWESGGHINTNTGFATHGYEYPDIGDDALSTKNPDFDQTTVRGLALKVPLVMAGWGFDVNGKPVPTGDNIRHRTDLWKCGPLDCRWDDQRKVWVAAGQGDTIGVVIQHSGWFDSSSGYTGRPRYIVRLIDSMDASGTMQFANVDDKTPPLSGNDVVVFNIQEAYQDLHLLGVGSPVLVHEQFGIKFLNEHVRTLIQRNLY